MAEGVGENALCKADAGDQQKCTFGIVAVMPNSTLCELSFPDGSHRGCLCKVPTHLKQSAHQASRDGQTGREFWGSDPSRWKTSRKLTWITN